MITKVTEIKYTYRKNLGNYEHEETTVVGVIEEKQDAISCLKELVELARTDLSKTVYTKKEDKVPEQLELPKQTEDSPKEENTEVAEPKTKSKGKAAKAVPKLTPYNRENDLHKKFFSEVLQEHFPEWKKDITKAKEVSVKLNGMDMLDAEGAVVQTFKDAVIEKMKA